VPSRYYPGALKLDLSRFYLDAVQRSNVRRFNNSLEFLQTELRSNTIGIDVKVQ